MQGRHACTELAWHGLNDRPSAWQTQQKAEHRMVLQEGTCPRSRKSAQCSTKPPASTAPALAKAEEGKQTQSFAARCLPRPVKALETTEMVCRPKAHLFVAQLADVRRS